jgi:uncharacterized protein
VIIIRDCRNRIEVEVKVKVKEKTPNLKGIALMTIDVIELTKYCEANNIHWLAMFGSALHGGLRPDSDVDLLVEFNEPAGLFTLCRIEEELSARFFDGRKVDLATKHSISRYFRDEVLSTCKTIYGSTE